MRGLLSSATEILSLAHRQQLVFYYKEAKTMFNMLCHNKWIFFVPA